MATFNPDTNPFRSPPDTVPAGYIGWRYVKAHDIPGRWRPVAWELVYPADHPNGAGILTVDYETELCVKDSTLYDPAPAVTYAGRIL